MTLCHWNSCLQVRPTYSFNKVYLINFISNWLPSTKANCVLIFWAIFSLSTMENILDTIFIISTFQQVLLISTWSYGSQDTGLRSWGSKQIYHKTIKTKLIVLSIYESIMTNFISWNLFHHLPHRIIFPMRYSFPKSESWISSYGFQKFIAQQPFI